MSKKVFPTRVLLIVMVWMPALHFLWPGTVIFPVPWSLFGLIPLTAGIILNLAADGAFHTAGTTVKPLEESTALVTGGRTNGARLLTIQKRRAGNVQEKN